MQKFFVEESQIENKQVRIEGEDIKHIRNVLRLLEGERIQVCNLDTGENYLCPNLQNIARRGCLQFY